MRGGSDEAALPASAGRAFDQHAGALIAREPLGGMSSARVQRLTGERGSAVLKQTPAPVEFAFYTRLAPALRRAGVPIPALISAAAPSEAAWLLIEDIALPAPPVSPDGQPNAQVLAALACLHGATRGATFDLPPAVVPLWSAGPADADIEAALELFPAAQRAELRALLGRCAPRGGRSPDAPCWISGDPNPRNWAARADGSVALFDWELFQLGEPATDLAISVAGLGSGATFLALAEDYLAVLTHDGQAAPWSAGQLARAMAQQKVLTVVRLLAGSAHATVRPPPGLIDTLVQRVPAWLAKLDT